MLDNREWAALIWLAIATLVALSIRAVRSQILPIIRTFLSAVILVPFGAMAAYVGAEIWIGDRIGPWRSDLIKGTIVWFSVSGVALFFNFSEASKEHGFLRSKAKTTIGSMVFVEFLVNLTPMRFLVEFFLQPLATLLSLVAIVTANNEQHASVQRWAKGALAALGLWVFGFSVWATIQQRNEIDGTGLFLQFLLPVWLTIGLLPFIFGLSWYATFKDIFNRIDTYGGNWIARWRAQLAVLSTFGFNTHDARCFAGYWPRKVAAAENVRSARAVVSDFLRSRRDEERTVIEARERLERYEGVKDTDAEGRRLDHREFRETIESLHWLATCQSGWYSKENRYRPELLDLIKSGFPRCGLPTDCGIKMKVAEDGQSWYAWRRTVTGWCFAIGASQPPPEQDWEYDGPDPPDGFPGLDPKWGSGPFSYEANKNW